MAQLKYGSAGVTATEIDISGPVSQQPTGVPAGVIGTSVKGPAFVPITVGVFDDFVSKFGPTDGKKFGPLAANEWLKNAGALTYVRVLGVGTGQQHNVDGSVTSAGFTVGENEPNSTDGTLSPNPYANLGGPPGRTYFLGAFMSESAGSTVFSSANLQGVGSVNSGANVAVPIVRGILMTPSGVIARISSSFEGTSYPPSASYVALDSTAQGKLVGSVVLMSNNTPKQDFVLLLNGHMGTNPLYPNVITASFDMTSPNYFANVLNSDPYNYQLAGHFLYANYDIHPVTAVVTGSGIISASFGAGANGLGIETAAFLTTSSLARATGGQYVPNYESFTDRFSHAVSPWIISQKFGGQPQQLFRLWSIDAGTGVSTLYKISIQNLAPSSDPLNQYGTFDLVIRDWNDQDSTQNPLETWNGLSLDPSDDRYIAKVVGDVHAYYDFDRPQAEQKLVIDGNYPNASNLVRVEVSNSVDQGIVDPTALPMGFSGPMHLITSGSQQLTSPTSTQVPANILNKAIEVPVPMRQTITIGSGNKIQVNSLLYWGVQFEHVTQLTQPNISTLKNDTLKSMAVYFPSFATTNANFNAGNNSGTPDTAQLGIVDCNRFNYNQFTLENVQIVTGSAGSADPNQWANAVYVRGGNVTPNSATATRALLVNDATQANRKFMKFSFFMQGGFDGTNIFDKDESEINNNAVVADMNTTNRGRNAGSSVSAYTTALGIMQNVVSVDVQLLAIPGIRNPIITDAMVNAVESRFDAMGVMDIEQVDNNGANVVSDTQLPSVQLTAAQFANRGVDSSFAAAYFPDTIVTDPTTQTNVVVPPSVVVLGALALNDAVGYPWFAPAGFTRGALASTLEARVQLSKNNMDTLYDVNVNPLVAFPGNATSGTNPKGGVVVWGQKTLQLAASALDRVNVRRLLINIRRQVRDISQTIVFEPNRAATLTKFSSAVTPILQKVQSLSGVTNYKVVIDASTTTQADIDNNTVRGKIYVQPTKSIEYVSLDFVVTNNIQNV
jgi:phage tail sheath protein FI